MLEKKIQVLKEGPIQKRPTSYTTTICIESTRVQIKGKESIKQDCMWLLDSDLFPIPSIFPTFRALFNSQPRQVCLLHDFTL
jgi:hypothetical protein